MKVTVSLLKKTGAEHGVTFPNMLAAVITEDLLKRLFSTSFANVICLRNLCDFTGEAYARGASRRVELYYCERQIVPDLKSPGAPVGEEVLSKMVSEMFSESLTFSCLEDVTYNTEIRDELLEITAKFDKFEVPVTVSLIPLPEASFRATDSRFELFIKPGMDFFIYEYPPECILADNGFEIFEKLELLGEMNMYLEAYDILSSKMVSGRVVREWLLHYCEKNGLAPTLERLESLRGYRDYKYMQKKWKVLLRRKKRTAPAWNEALSLVLDFYGPIWEAICENGIFLEDWMYEIRKFM